MSLAVKLDPDTLAAAFLVLLRQEGLPQPHREFKFHPDRLWRMDYCWPTLLVGLEVDGGIWIKGGGRHNRGAGWLKDAAKLNAAAALGYRMLRCTPDQLCTPQLVDTLRATLAPLTSALP